MIAKSRSLRAALLGAALSLGGIAAVAAPPPTAAPGYTLSVFAAPTDVSAPDSILAFGGHVWVGYGNKAAPDGSKGSSNIIEYNLDGSVVRNLLFKGHNDGLRLDPTSGHLWVLMNEDAMPRLITVDPATGVVKRNMALTPVNGGGYDDAAFINGRIYISASNPALDADGVNRHPAVVTLAPTDNGFVPETVLSGDSLAVNAITHEAVKLNLTDPDSLTVTPNGNLLLDDQGDAQLIKLEFHAGKAPFISQIPLVGGVQVDDTVFATSRSGTLYISDTAANTVYALTSRQFLKQKPYTASTGVAATPTTPAVPAFVGELHLRTGVTVPIVTGLSSPHGMIFLGAVPD